MKTKLNEVKKLQKIAGILTESTETSSDTIKSLALDITIDGLKDPDFIDYLDKNDIPFKILAWRGPGGGNPEVEFYATREKLINFLRDQYSGGDEEDVEFQASYIK